MARKQRREPEKPKVERVVIVDRKSGTICTVGSDVVDKYLSGVGKKAKFREYDPAIDERNEDDDDIDDDYTGEDEDSDPETSDVDVAKNVGTLGAVKAASAKKATPPAK